MLNRRRKTRTPASASQRVAMTIASGGSADLVAIVETFNGSNGPRTVELFERLKAMGAAGVIAVNLFRACKNSERAKVYRGGNGDGSYRRQAYDRKHWAIGELCKALEAHGAGLEEERGIKLVWGWATDPQTKVFDQVFYVDLPTGQVSFHMGERMAGPDYAGSWDGVRDVGPERICKFIDHVLRLDPERLAPAMAAQAEASP